MKFAKSGDDKRFAVYSALFAVIVALVLIFFAAAPRARVNVMQGIAVLFLAVTFSRLQSRGKDPEGEWIGAAGSTPLLPVIGMVLAAGIWAAGLNSYFINDDFGILQITRGLNVALLASFFGRGHHIFYRPLAFTTFAVDQFFWAQNPVGFHLTNLILHAASTAGLFLMTQQLTRSRRAAFMTAGIFFAMPIQVESVTWMSSRFDVLATCLCIWTVMAYLWFRAKGGFARYALALGICALAICSKETAFVLPLLLCAIEILVFRSLPVLRLAGFFATAAVLFAWRWIALGGFGGYREGGRSAMGFTPNTLVTLLVRGPTHLLLGFNWTQPSVWLVAVAALTAALLLFIALCAKLTDMHRQMILLGCAWMFVSMVPGHFMLAIGPGLSNSRILYLPSAGMALLLGQLLSAVPLRRQNLGYTGLTALFMLGVWHNLQAWRWTSNVGAETLRQVVQLEPFPPANAQFVVSNLPTDIRGVFFFDIGLTEGLQMFYGRNDVYAYRDVAPSGSGPQIRLIWNGDGNLDQLIRRE
jgi:hypothetical protein